MFLLGPWVGLDKYFYFFFFFLGGGGGGGARVSGTTWVVTTSGLLPDNAGIHWKINHLGGGANHR